MFSLMTLRIVVFFEDYIKNQRGSAETNSVAAVAR